MTNREKYAEQIIDIAINDIIIAVDKKGRVYNCNEINCSDCMWDGCNGSCGDELKEWAEQEYSDSSVDWSKVPVDAKILVRDSSHDLWLKRYFARYEENRVYTWKGGTTSYSSDGYNDVTCWIYAKLAEDGI